MERMTEFLIVNGVEDDRKKVAVLLSTVGPSIHLSSFEGLISAYTSFNKILCRNSRRSSGPFPT